MISGKQAEINRLLAPLPHPFDDTARWLATNEADVCRNGCSTITTEPTPYSFKDGTGQLELARMTLAREFARRPKRLNSLETMGLVAIQYPKLEAVRASCPLFRCKRPCRSMTGKTP